MVSETNNYTEKVYSFDELKSIIAPIAEKYGILQAYVFGSYAKDQAKPQSDVDILVKEDGSQHAIMYYIMWDELRESLKKPVDLINFGSFDQGSDAEIKRRHQFRDAIAGEQRLVYECR